ncbi:ribonuclease BN [Abditibacteriota bacterium]|nr:ribonuclease BN [Abditibacteriota bacterium]
MRVKFWGVRGSLPSPPTSDEIAARLTEALYRLGQDGSAPDLSDRASISRWVEKLPHSVRSFAGGNTPCVEVQIGNSRCIFDLGSGLRPLGDALMNEEFGHGAGHAHLFLSHLHWDHIQGWPFFKPAYVPGNRFDLYARHECAWERLRDQQSAPFFPPEAWGEMSADTQFHHLPYEPLEFADGLKISTLELEHPSLAYAFRLEANGKTFVYASDGAYPEPANGERNDPAQKFLRFFEGADILVFDSQFSLAESMEKRAWGHSSAVEGVKLAAHAGAKRLAMFHHDPSASDAKLEQQLRISREYAAHPPTPCKPNAVEVVLAREGMEIEL